MQKIVITIREGRLTGVYTDGEPIMVDLIDYDDLLWETEDVAGDNHRQHRLFAHLCYSLVRFLQSVDEITIWKGLMK